MGQPNATPIEDRRNAMAQDLISELAAAQRDREALVVENLALRARNAAHCTRANLDGAVMRNLRSQIEKLEIENARLRRGALN